jgi:hypothetical protein
MITIKQDTYNQIDPKVITKAINNALDIVGPKMAQDAKNKHRYKTRTGNLERATNFNRIENKAKVYIDDIKAKYGKYIHDGYKNKAPDRFIDQAVDNNLTLLDETFAKEIDKLIGDK